MSQFKGTPGPWEVVPGDEWMTDIGTPEGEYEDGRKRHWNVASVNRRRDGWEANRLLIAAAPDSHEANVKFIEAIESLCGITPAWNDDCIYDGLPSSGLAIAYFAARAAIAKATGGAA